MHNTDKSRWLYRLPHTQRTAQHSTPDTTQLHLGETAPTSDLLHCHVHLSGGIGCCSVMPQGDCLQLALCRLANICIYTHSMRTELHHF